MDSPVATLELIEVAASGARTPIHVAIGRPRPDGRGAWCCFVVADGVDHKARDIFGEDSLQALCLGLEFVRIQLDSVLERGSRLVHADEDTDFSVDAYFKPSA